MFTFTVTNPGKTAVDVRLLQSQQNLIGWNGSGTCTDPTKTKFWGGNVNTATANGITMANPSQPSGKDRSNTLFGTLAMASVPTPSAAKTTIILSEDSETNIFTAFTKAQDVAPVAGTASAPSAASTSYCGGVVQTVTVAPGATETVTFILTWSFPNRGRDARCEMCLSSEYCLCIGNKGPNYQTEALCRIINTGLTLLVKTSMLLFLLL